MAYADDYEDDRGERTIAGEVIQGICRDCGNGSLNNLLVPAFELVEHDYADGADQAESLAEDGEVEPRLFERSRVEVTCRLHPRCCGEHAKQPECLE